MVKSLKELGVEYLVGWREKEILEVVSIHGGRATWSDFIGLVERGVMARSTLGKKLKSLAGMGVLEKRRERVGGRETWIYRFASEEVLQLFGEMERRLTMVLGELYDPVAQPGLDTADRGKALIDCVDDLLRYQRSLTLMAVRLAVQAPDDGTAVRRLIKLMSRFTDVTAGGALAACWLNRDISVGVLDAMLGPPPRRVEEEVYVEAGLHE